MITRIYFITLLLLVTLFINTKAQTQIKLDSLINESNNFAIASETNSDYALEMTAGDFNGDGIQDIAISSAENTGSSDSDTRSINIIFGSTTFDESITDSFTIIYRSNDPTLLTYHGFGTELGTGDLNNDGIDDLIIGMPLHDDQKGRLYVVYGKTSRTESVLNIAGLTAQDGFMLNGPNGVSGGNGSSQLGYNYAIGDFDNDNLNDLFVSSFNQFTSSGYVVFGKAIQGELTIGLDTLSRNSGMYIYTTISSDNLGNDAAFLDINGDGIEDLLMASEGAWSQGRIYTLFGSSSLPDSANISSINRGVNGLTIFGSFNPTQTRFGKDFDMGDFNGDGVMDFIVSATRTGTTKGSVYIIFGGAGVFDDNVYPTLLSAGEGLTINGESLNYLGKFLDVADFNNDGIDDIVFTGGIHDLSSNLTENYDDKLRVLLGSDRVLPDVLDLENPSPEFDLFEITTPSRFSDIGNSVTATDINNDGNQDLIFGSRFDDPNSSSESFSSYFILNVDLSTTKTDTSISDTVLFSGGTGTPEDPYLISNAEQLDSVRLFMDKSFLLTTDLDLTTANEYGWVPIGYDRNDQYLVGEREVFTGCFDGGGNTISNLTIHNRGKNVGLFYSVSGCVKNLILDNSAITYIAPEDMPDSLGLSEIDLIEDIPRFVGIVASRIELGGKVENIDVLNSSIEFGSVGMIAGWNEGSVSDSYAQGEISDANQSGGITAVNLGSIHQSAFEGSLIHIENAAGGIVGTNLEGSITESYTTVSIQKTGTFGGLSGIYQYGILENNYAEFEVQDSSSVGGIVGFYGLSGILNSPDKPLSIKYNYAFGEIESKTVLENYYKGIIGQAFMNSSDSAQTVLKVSDNYWNTELFGREDSLFGFRIQTGGRSTLEMKQESTFENWEFTSIWTIDVGETFPYLRNNPPNKKPGEGIMSTSNQIETELPQRVSLYQNYPNPFNPSTQIRYELVNSSTVRLEIFNILGQKIQTLVDNKVQTSGSHSVVFNAQGLSSGIYIYQLRVGDGFTLTKKLTLIK